MRRTATARLSSARCCSRSPSAALPSTLAPPPLIRTPPPSSDYAHYNGLGVARLNKAFASLLGGKRPKTLRLDAVIRRLAQQLTGDDATVISDVKGAVLKSMFGYFHQPTLSWQRTLRPTPPTTEDSFALCYGDLSAAGPELTALTRAPTFAALSPDELRLYSEGKLLLSVTAGADGEATTATREELPEVASSEARPTLSLDIELDELSDSAVDGMLTKWRMSTAGKSEERRARLQNMLAANADFAATFEGFAESKPAADAHRRHLEECETLRLATAAAEAHKDGG